MERQVVEFERSEYNTPVLEDVMAEKQTQKFKGIQETFEVEVEGSLSGSL